MGQMLLCHSIGILENGHKHYREKKDKRHLFVKIHSIIQLKLDLDQ